MFKSLHFLWGNSKSLKIIPCLLVLPLVIISSDLVQCAISESTTISGKCEESKDIGRGRTIKCSNYTEIPTNILNPETVKYLLTEKGNNMLFLKKGSLIRSKLIALQNLKLQNCKIRFVEPGAFAGGTKLLLIDLTDNLITTLKPDVFSDLLKLEAIILKMNPIKRIVSDETFHDLPQLSTLDLSYCQLVSMHTNIFDKLKNLKNLYLVGNHLKNLDWRMFRKAKSLHILALDDNPWHCDCEVKFVMETLKNLSNLNKSVYSATCSSADKLTSDWVGKSWNYAPEHMITCSPKINQFVYASYSFPGQRNESTDNLTVKIGHDVYFDCEYSGYPKPKIMWFKDNQKIKTNLTEISPKIEFQDETIDLLWNMDEDERRNNYHWKERLIVRRVQARDKGSYKCFVQIDGPPVHKTLYLYVELVQRAGETPTSAWIWTLVGMSSGFIILAGIVAIFIPGLKRRWFREQRGELKDSSIELEDFSTDATFQPTKQFQYTRFT